MGKTIRNYNGEGMKPIKKMKPKKAKKKFRSLDFYEDDDYYDGYQSNDDNLRADNDN